MPHSNPDDSLLLIRCPSCGQRFKVGEDLRGRTVECGGCEHRFRINDEVIVRGKKFYPGERKNPALNRFQRVPLSVAPTALPNLPSVSYQDAPSPVSFEPAPPQRIVAGVVGVAGMVFMALLLMFGADRGGVLDGMTTQNRLLMAGFTGLLGIAFLIYANPRARLKALAAGLLMMGGLLAVPFFFTTGSVPLKSLAETAPEAPVGETELKSSGNDELAALRDRINTRPLDEEIERLKREGGSRRAFGIWLRGMASEYRYQVKDYIHLRTASLTQPHPYPRGGGDFLMVVPATSRSLSELAEIAADLGSVENVYPELSVVEVRVNNDKFVEGPIEKLTNSQDPAFYDLNKRELECVDLKRVNRAVKRLAEAEPKVYRSDISRKLLNLLAADWVDFKGDVCAALAVWSDKPGIAGETALKELDSLIKRKVPVPREMVALIVREKNHGVVPNLVELWREDPVKWEELLGEMGPAAEAPLIREFPTTQGALRRSAARLMGRLGGAGCLPLLEAAASEPDAELKVIIEKSIASIRVRLGQ